MKPFTDKFMDKFTATVIKPVEQNLGIKFSDYQGLSQGQVTYALLPVTPKDNYREPFGRRLAGGCQRPCRPVEDQPGPNHQKMGRRRQTGQIPENSRSWILPPSSSPPTTFPWSKIFPATTPPPPDDTAAKPQPKTFQLTLGQSDSLLLVSDSTEAIDKVLSLQAGGLVPPLEDSPAFQADYAARLRESPAYVWLNVNALMTLLTKPPAGAADAAARQPVPPGHHP